jgi:protein-S-isoprenylcysteine O-methyltransferase Ste14
MDTRPPETVGPASAGLLRLWARGLVRILIIVALFQAILLLAAGRIDWAAAWLLAFLLFAFLLIMTVWGMRNTPELVTERERVVGNVKTWDKVVNALYAVLLVALLVTAGLDAGRNHWSSMAMPIQALGVVGLLFAGWLIWRTMAENAYLSRWARIQADRGQKVVSSGPYRYVRHPMYAAIILLVLCTAIALGSWWALIPSGLIGGVFAFRTLLEDRMLHEELTGYQEYATRVRYRLLPWVW